MRARRFLTAIDDGRFKVKGRRICAIEFRRKLIAGTHLGLSVDLALGETRNSHAEVAWCGVSVHSYIGLSRGPIWRQCEGVVFFHRPVDRILISNPTN